MLPPTLPAALPAMPRTMRLASVLTAIALTACSSGAGPSEPPGPAGAAEAEPDPTTVDGIFTSLQAERGEALFRSSCAECHDTSDWTENGFRARWENESVFRLWYYINDRMPYDDPWSLTRQQVTDVLSYIFELNGLPAGERELATDDDSIDDYWIVWEQS